MIKVGNLEQIFQLSTAVANDVEAVFDVPMDKEENLKIAIVFSELKDGDEAHQVRWTWSTDEPKVRFEFTGWKYALAGSLGENPIKFGEYNGRELLLQIGHWYAQKVHLITVLVFKGQQP